MKDRNGFEIHRGQKVKVSNSFGVATGHLLNPDTCMLIEPQKAKKVDISGAALLVHRTLDGEMVAAHDPTTKMAFEFWGSDECSQLEIQYV